MHSIPPAHSIAQVRQRATAGARGKWSARQVMRAIQASQSYGITKHVLTWLLLLADGRPSVTVKIDKLAKDTGLTREATRYHLRRLRQLRDISSDGHGGRGHANEWHLDVLDRLTDGGDAA